MKKSCLSFLLAGSLLFQRVVASTTVAPPPGISPEVQEEMIRAIRSLPETPLPIARIGPLLVGLGLILGGDQEDPNTREARLARADLLDEIDRKIHAYLTPYNEKRWREFFKRDRELRSAGRPIDYPDATRAYLGIAGELSFENLRAKLMQVMDMESPRASLELLKRRQVKDLLYQSAKVTNPALTREEWESSGDKPNPGNGTIHYASIEEEVQPEQTFIPFLNTLDPDPHIRGRQFEEAAKWYLLNDPKYRMLLKNVWSWNDWPEVWGRDAGIDLVAETHAGELWAIQCKAYGENSTVQKRHIDSFLSESSRKVFTHRILIATTDRVSHNALRTIEDQEKSVGLILRSDLEEASLQWPSSFQTLYGPKKTPNPIVSRPDQQRAVSDVLNGYEDHDRGQMHRACGTGKTFISIWVRDALKAKSTLVAVPSLSLIHQTIRAWTENANEPFDYLVVCSDKTVANGKAPDEISTSNLGVPVTTDVSTVHRFLNSKHDRPTVVFTTYHSSDVIARAQKNVKDPFDFLVSDEAQFVAGRAQSVFGTVADEKKIRAKKRLFMTATPKILTENVKARAEKHDLKVISMDDEDKFGPVFHRLSFKEALDQNLLTDYQVVVMVVTENEVREAVKEGRLVLGPDDVISDARTLASQVALAKAMKKYDLRRVITFHSTVAKAQQFASDQATSFRGTMRMIPKRDRPDGNFWVGHIEAKTPAGKRAAILKSLEELPNDSRGVLANCACLGVGVDVPALDGVAFMDPRRSEIDIIQATGRVMRKSPGKKVGTIFIPVYLEDAESDESALERSEFSNVWQVLRALRAHDETLAQYLDEVRTHLGKPQTPVRKSKVKLPDNIIFDLPEKLQVGFASAIQLKAITMASAKPRLTNEIIKMWVADHYLETGEYPTQNSGSVLAAPEEKYGAVNRAISDRYRGYNGSYTSLADLIDHEFGFHRRKKSPSTDLRIKEMLIWADNEFKRSGEYPTRTSGRVVEAPEEDYERINSAFRLQTRGTKKTGCKSWSEFLKKHRGVERTTNRSPLTERNLLKMVKDYYQENGKFPSRRSGNEWNTINETIRTGGRQFPKKYRSLPDFIRKNFDFIQIQ